MIVYQGLLRAVYKEPLRAGLPRVAQGCLPRPAQGCLFDGIIGTPRRSTEKLRRFLSENLVPVIC